MPRILATLSVFCLLAAAAAGAAVPELPRFRVLGVADGLPSSSVLALARDRSGYVWIATLDGLARYDGVGFRIWRHVPGDPRALPGNNVQALHVDAQDRVWVATEFGGISVLDAARSGFTHYRRATHPRIGSDDTWAFASRNGTLWFGTADGGLHRLDADGRITRWTHVDGLPSDTILTLVFDAGGTLWIGTDAGLARWDGTRMRAVALPGADAAPVVYSLTRTADALFAGTAAGVLRRGIDGAWSMPAWSPMFARPNAMLSFAQDPDGACWIGSQRGLWHARAGGVPMPVRLGERTPGKPVLSLLPWQRALWAPVPGAGLGYLRSDWRHVAQFSRRDGSLGADRYRSIAPSRDGGLWLAGSDGVVEHLGGDGTAARLPQSGIGPLEHTNFASVAEDRDGRLWLGHRGGLLRMDGARVDAWTGGHHEYPLPDGMVDLLRLAPDGTLWLSAQGGGIQQRDARSGAVIAQALVGEDPAIGSGDTEAMAFDAGGRLWIAGGMGLARWDALRGHFVSIPELRGARVHAFGFDGADDLWLQRITGLEHYRRADDRWTRMARVSVAQQLPAVEGADLRIDAAHRVWLSTRRGLFRWDPRARRLQRFGVAEGLLSQELEDHALALTPAGAIATTTIDGVVMLFDTRAKDSAPATSTLRIDGFDVRRQGRWQPWPARTAVVLRPGDHEWRVRLRLLAYDAPAAARYWTRLDGFDRGWIAQGDERVFAGLPAGRYVLHARAVDAAGNAAREQVLRLQVLPPWWRSGWMAAVLMIACALLLWRAVRTWKADEARAQALERIAHDRELARAASDAKSEFLATFGHEVRTPMTGVLGMTELLLDTSLAHQQRTYAESIRGAGQHLLRLVDDALDLARIEAGKLELVDADFDLHALLREVGALFAPVARAKGIVFECAIAPALPRMVRGDGHRVRQILLNLCSNAIKFTAQGRVTLRGHALASGVRLEVQDTGPGMEARIQNRLFQRFEQADGARTAVRYGGSGLGLAICRELATAMGGSIDVDSRPGAGSTFRVDLPLVSVEAAAHATHAAVAEAGAQPRRGYAILLVEDDALVAEVVQGQLQARGHAVTRAAHALDALAAMQATTYDLALLDLDLPGIDGIELAGLLRSLGHRLPLLALTARTDPHAEPMALAAGMDGFLRKPVEGERLVRAIAGVLETGAAAAPLEA
jgi:ligand-binding sensor domain-containing protein/signal transduction histidine kinase/CheY-like chemotaxis protein